MLHRVAARGLLHRRVLWLLNKRLGHAAVKFEVVKTGRSLTDAAETLVMEDGQVKTRIGWFYRYQPTEEELPREWFILCRFLVGLMWAWIYWHMWFHGSHLIPEFYDPINDYTDEELGIPPDDWEPPPSDNPS